ncbi:MAG: acyl carrier protein [Oscillospiraceae bacterium]|nr:acyl carrier protein [Oscillospiraceae bacterium]MCD8116928.1 acyl carrier protein [Oscillospiraceae bacterium]
MEVKMIYAKLTKIFRDLFDNDSIVLTPETTAKDVEGWDSLAHITLIVTIERTFKMKFKMKEVSSMKNVGQMVAIIESRSKL